MHKHSSGMQSLSWSETADTETWITMPQALIAHTSKRQFAWIGMELVMDSIKQNTYIADDLVQHIRQTTSIVYKDDAPISTRESNLTNNNFKIENIEGRTTQKEPAQ